MMKNTWQASLTQPDLQAPFFRTFSAASETRVLMIYCTILGQPGKCGAASYVMTFREVPSWRCNVIHPRSDLEEASTSVCP